MWKMLIMQMKQPSSGRHRPATHPVLQFVGIISRASGLLADPAAPPPICRLRHVSFFPLPDQQCPCCPSCCLFVLSSVPSPAATTPSLPVRLNHQRPISLAESEHRRRRTRIGPQESQSRKLLLHGPRSTAKEQDTRRSA